MNHLEILEKLCDTTFNPLEYESSLYIYSAGIYDIWSNGTELEKNLLNRLLTHWSNELKYAMTSAYTKTKYDKDRLEREEYCKKWIESIANTHKDHKGILKALEQIKYTE